MAYDANRLPDDRVILKPLAHPVIVRRDISNAEIGDMLDWCKDDAQPGSFRHRFDHSIPGMVVSFSDENVAFEFKIRWG